jgi:hypothetical protein
VDRGTADYKTSTVRAWTARVDVGRPAPELFRHTRALREIAPAVHVNVSQDMRSSSRTWSARRKVVVKHWRGRPRPGPVPAEKTRTGRAEAGGGPHLPLR